MFNVCKSFVCGGEKDRQMYWNLKTDTSTTKKLVLISLCEETKEKNYIKASILDRVNICIQIDIYSNIHSYECMLYEYVNIYKPLQFDI